MENLEEETRMIMKMFNITANKSLGQNFLINEQVIQKIIQASEITKEDVIIEIGPGLGTLTSRLLEKAKRVIAIELDERMVKILKKRFLTFSNFELLSEDILKVNLKELIRLQKQDNEVKNVKIVANLPYYITTPIIMKLLEEKLDINSITVMVQKEVAQRLTAIPSSKLSGAITYTVNYYAKAQEIFEVPKESFIPEPDVMSEVIKLELRKEPVVIIKDEEIFFKIIKQAFMQRRKTLVNALSNCELFKEKEQILKILNALNINDKIRGEALTIEQFAQIANIIS